MQEILIIAFIVLSLTNLILWYQRFYWKNESKHYKQFYEDQRSLLEDYLNKKEGEIDEEVKNRIASRLKSREISTLRYKYKELLRVIQDFNSSNNAKIKVDEHLLPNYEANKLDNKIFNK